jgi:hypothetical protein
MTIAQAFDNANARYNAMHPVTVINCSNVLYNHVEYTPDELKKMREWVKDCQWNEAYGPGEIDELPALTILKGVDLHYCGGLIAFKQEVQQGII